MCFFRAPTWSNARAHPLHVLSLCGVFHLSLPVTAHSEQFSSTAARCCSTARCPLQASYGEVLRQCECLTVQTPHLLTFHCTLCTAHQEQCKGAVSALVLSHSSVCCERSAGPGSAVQCKPVKCTLQMTKLAVQTLWIRYIAEHPCVVCKWLQFSNGPPSPIRGNSKQSASRTLDSKLPGTILKWINRCRIRKEKFSVYQTFQIVERKSEHGNHCAGGLVRPGRRYALSVDRFMTQNGTKIHIYLELCKICRRLTFLKLCMCKITIHTFMKWNGTKIHIYTWNCAKYLHTE